MAGAAVGTDFHLVAWPAGVGAAGVHAPDQLVDQSAPVELVAGVEGQPVAGLLETVVGQAAGAVAAPFGAVIAVVEFLGVELECHLVEDAQLAGLPAERQAVAPDGVVGQHPGDAAALRADHVGVGLAPVVVEHQFQPLVGGRGKADLCQHVVAAPVLRVGRGAAGVPGVVVTLVAGFMAVPPGYQQHGIGRVALDAEPGSQPGRLVGAGTENLDAAAKAFVRHDDVVDFQRAVAHHAADGVRAVQAGKRSLDDVDGAQAVEVDVVATGDKAVGVAAAGVGVGQADAVNQHQDAVAVDATDGIAGIAAPGRVAGNVDAGLVLDGIGHVFGQGGVELVARDDYGVGRGLGEAFVGAVGGDFDGLEAGQFFCQCRESGGKTQDKRGKTGNSHENSTGIGFSLAGMRLAGGDYLVRMSLLLLVRRRR